MPQNSLESKKREFLGKLLNEYDIKIVEGYKSLLELSKEIAEKNYEILFSGEAEINDQHIISMAVIWPKVNGTPSEMILERAEIFGHDHFSTFRTHEMFKFLKLIK